MKVNTLVKKINLSLSPLEAYKRLCNGGNKKHSLLFETAEVASHANPKSIIAVSSAVKISSLNNSVVIEALNANGQAFLDGLDCTGLNSFEVESTNSKIQLNLKCIDACNSEDGRLIQDSVLSVLRFLKQQLATGNNEDDTTSYFLGAFSFDLVDQFESLPSVKKSDEDYVFYLADQLLVQSLDNNSGQIIVKGFAKNSDNDVHLGLKLAELESLLQKEIVMSENKCFTDKVTVDISDEEFSKQVVSAKQHIVDGDVFQVVLSRNYTINCPAPISAYQKLRETNPSPYMFYLNFGNKQLFGASPESCLKVSHNREVSLYPIAGTRKRAFNHSGIDFERDSQIEYQLIDDKKETAEHMMLVDLARNDLARIVEPNSRKVTQLKQVVKYSHVMHLVSEVKGKLQSDIDPLDAYKACANMGTLTGAPKIKAVEIIRKYEKSSRGFYGGAVAVFNALDEFDSAIVIRSALVKNQRAIITAGAGIVHDSIPSQEAKETENKAKAVINACLAAFNFPHKAPGVVA